MADPEQINADSVHFLERTERPQPGRAAALGNAA